MVMRQQVTSRGSGGDRQAGVTPPPSGAREAVIAAFLARQDVMPSSLRTYRQSITRYLDWVESTGRELRSLTSADIIESKRHLIGTGLSTLTVRSYMVAVRRFYKWAEGMRLYEDIAAGVKSPRPRGGGPDGRFMKMHLTDAQGAALLRHFSGHPRNYAMVNLMLRTGLRTIEVSRARICDITLRSGKRVLRVWGKGMEAPDPSVYVILTDASYAPIAGYLATRPRALPGEPLFATDGKGSHGGRPHSGGQMSTRLIQMIVKKGLRSIGLDDHAYSAHSLRHTTATQIIKRGGSIMDVKRALRHSSVNTSMIYTASIEEEERLEKSPESLLDKAFNSDNIKCEK